MARCAGRSVTGSRTRRAAAVASATTAPAAATAWVRATPAATPAAPTAVTSAPARFGEDVARREKCDGDQADKGCEAIIHSTIHGFGPE
ncbi:MAG: hypothetical protein LLG00_02820 [Planctomycetaceae bacterium]|nr:hypothetical protein [Planctomycetaceae bacterium]